MHFCKDLGRNYIALLYYFFLSEVHNHFTNSKQNDGCFSCKLFILYQVFGFLFCLFFSFPEQWFNAPQNVTDVYLLSYVQLLSL